MGNNVLLSFDVEEFDMPYEYDNQIPLEDQFAIGINGLNKVVGLVEDNDVISTFFTTANFANSFLEDIKNLSIKHEIASHTYFHSDFEINHLHKSKLRLEEIIGKQIFGIRMPRMMQVDPNEILNAGYLYDASIHPTFIPGRYCNFDKSRTIFMEKNGLIRIPASVTPNFRIPLFWLSFKNFPFDLYIYIILQTLRKDKYVSIYFHPWEFVDITNYNLPSYTTRFSSNDILLKRLDKLIKILKLNGDFITMHDFCSVRFNNKF